MYLPVFQQLGREVLECVAFSQSQKANTAKEYDRWLKPTCICQSKPGFN